MRMLLPALMLALAGTAAQAADNGVYLGAGVTDVQIDDIEPSDVSALADAELDDTSWKLIAGFRPLDNFAVEANYIDLGEESSNGFNTNAKAYGAFAVGFFPIGPIDLFVKGGLVQWEADGDILGFEYDEDGTEFAYGAGVQARLGSLGARLEYEQFDTDFSDDVKLLSLGVTWTFL